MTRTKASVKIKNLSPNEMLHIIETELDSFQLTNDFKKLPRIRQRRLLRALGLVRRLQHKFPQINYSLWRFLACDYKRKDGFILAEKTLSKRLDWRKYRKLEELEKYNLTPFIESTPTILDATSGMKGIWQNMDASGVLFLDINKDVNPNIVASNEKLPFRAGCFKKVVFDPPQFVLSKAENALPIHKRYGFWLRKQQFFDNLRAVNEEFARVLKEDGSLLMKFCTFNFEMKDVLKELTNFELVKNDSRPTKGRGKNTVHWLSFKKSAVSRCRAA